MTALSLLRRLHRWLGLLLAVPLLIQGVTGAVLALTPVLPDLAAVATTKGEPAGAGAIIAAAQAVCRPDCASRATFRPRRPARRRWCVSSPRPGRAARASTCASIRSRWPCSTAPARRWPDRLDQGAAHQPADRGTIRAVDHRLDRRRAARARDARCRAVVAAARAVARGGHGGSAGAGSWVPPATAWHGRHLEPRAAAGDLVHRRGAGVSADDARRARLGGCRSEAARPTGRGAGRGRGPRDRTGRSRGAGIARPCRAAAGIRCRTGSHPAGAARRGRRGRDRGRRGRCRRPRARCRCRTRGPCRAAELALRWAHDLHFGQALGPLWRALTIVTGLVLPIFAITGGAMWLCRRRRRVPALQPGE